MTLVTPTPHTFAVNEYATAANLNTTVSAATWMLSNAPEFFVWNAGGAGATTTCPSGAETTIHFDTVQDDNQGGYGGVSNPVYAPPVSGRYQFFAQVEFYPTVDTASSREVTIVSANTGVIGKARVPHVSGYATTVCCTSVLFPTGPGDTIYVQVNQDSGSSIGIDTGLGITWFAGRWVKN